VVAESKSDGATLKNVIRETSRTFRSKNREHLKKKKRMSLKQTVKDKTSRDLYEEYPVLRNVNESMKGYRPVSNRVKDGNDGLLAHAYHILNRWKNYFCQLWNLRGVNDVRQTN
jgi:hypothetical protein